MAVNRIGVASTIRGREAVPREHGLDEMGVRSLGVACEQQRPATLRDQFVRTQELQGVGLRRRFVGGEEPPGYSDDPEQADRIK